MTISNTNSEIIRCSIYGLYSTKNPDSIRYIGQTKNEVKRRVHSHISSSKKNCKTPVSKWIVKNIKEGYEIKYTTICIGEYNKTEIDCIKNARLAGWNLLNIADGGKGVIGWSPSEEQRKKVSEFQKGRIKSEQERNNISKALTGKKMPEHVKNILREIRKNSPGVNLGRKFSPEFCKKISERMKGTKYHLGHTKKVMLIDTSEIFNSVGDAAKKFNISKSVIHGVANGHSKQIYGMRFKYVD